MLSDCVFAGVLNAPPGFVEWAVMNGAVNDADTPLDNSEFSREFRAI